MLAPIALFAYCRPDHLARTLAALQDNTLASESELFVFSDAAKDDAAQDGVAAVREIISNISGFKSVNIIKRETNFGLANSIVDGVTRLCNEYGRIIVLEDDMIISHDFLEFMNDALSHYAEDKNVLQVSGYAFAEGLSADFGAYFLPIISSWGWGTWQRAWQPFERTAVEASAILSDSAIRHRFDVLGTRNFSSMLQSQLSGKLDSWAILWYAHVFHQNGLTLFPTRSRVVNIGLDGSGTHGEVGVAPTPPPTPAPAINSDWNVQAWPEAVYDDDIFMKLAHCLSHKEPLFRRMLTKLKSFLSWDRTK